MKILKKRISSKILSINIFIKSFLNKNKGFEDFPINDLIENFLKKDKIIVVCNGPSASKVKISNENLYLVTNNGKDLMQVETDYLYYVNDGFYIKKILSKNSFLKNGQNILFYYNNSIPHKNGLAYLLKNIHLLENKKKYFISSEIDNLHSIKNYNDFYKFYEKRNLPVKIQNSGVFILLFGYYLAYKMNLPIEIYGLDLGVGGNIHFNNKGVVGKSVIHDRVKKNTKMYLNFMYKEYPSIKNYSNFNPN